jgi:hypothetical protein
LDVWQELVAKLPEIQAAVSELEGTTPSKQRKILSQERVEEGEEDEHVKENDK